MQQVTFQCDGCGITKGATNNWFRMRVGNALHIYHWDDCGDGATDDSIAILHVCGRECAQKKISEWMGQ